MWNKFKRLKYPVLVAYFLIGIIVSVLIYQFVTNTIRNQALQFDALFFRETGILMISCVLGALFGGLIYLVLTLNEKGSEVKDQEFWQKIKNAKISTLLKRNMLALSMGGFTGLLVQKMLQMDSHPDLFRALFSYQNLISYLGIILAACIFAIFVTLGIVKRLKQLYGN